MDATLEAAILDVLERFGDASAVDDAWLREHHPRQWREIRAFLDFEARVAGGSPRGTRVGPYRLLRRLGRGGAGTVYLAERVSDPQPSGTSRPAKFLRRDAGEFESASRGLAPGERVSLKVLHPHLAERRGFVERTVAEARAAATVAHPNVVRTLDADVATGPGGTVAYVATEFVDGQNLRGLLDDLGPLGEPLVRHLAAEILRALEAIHAAGLVHGDLKPENVLLGGGEAVKLADFGAATPSTGTPGGSSPGEARATPRGFRGTLLYAAPETITPSQGPVDLRADLYALGVMVEELLAGAHPFTGPVPGPRTERSAADGDEPDGGGPSARARTRRAADAPSEFLRAFAATLRAERPEDRFASASDALAALEAAEDSAWWRERCVHRPSSAVPPAPWSRSMARSAALRGREPELDRLLALLDAAAAGASRSAVVSGEPGSGRKRLVEELCDIASRRGAHVLWLTPGAASDAEESLHAAMRDAAARDVPIVVVVEDLDAPGADGPAVVRRLAGALAESRALLLATQLAGERTNARATPDAADRIELAPLGDEAVSAVVADVLDSDDLGDRLGPEIRRRTDGNPLAVLELLDELRAADRIVRDEAGRWILRGGPEALAGPMTARAILARRIASLARADRDLLAVAACAGLRFDVAIVARALGADAGRLLLRLARLERREHLVRAADGTFAFEHRQVREAVLADIAPDRLRELHAALARAIAETVSRRGPVSDRDAASITRHALAGADAPRAAEHVVAALRWLRESGRSAEVVELSTAALALDGAAKGRERALVLAERAHAHSTLARYGAARDDYADAAREAHDAGDESLSLEARALALDGIVETGRLAEAESRGRELLDECRRGGFAEAEAHALNGLARALRFQSKYDEAIVHARRFVDLRRRSGDARSLGVALHLLACAISERGDHEEALRVNAEAIEHLRKAGAATRHLVWALTVDGQSLGKLGRRSESFAAWEQGARAARSIGDAEMECICLVSSADQVRTLGRYDEARTSVERACALADRAGTPTLRFISHQQRSLLLVAAGRTAEALAEAKRCLEFATEGGMLVQRLRALAVLTGLHATWGDTAGARRRTEEMSALADGAGADHVRGLLQLIRGRWGGEDGRPLPDVLRDADRRLRASGGHDLAAIAVLELARIATEEGRRDDAVRGLEEARAVFVQHDIPGRAMECDTLLARLGARDPAAVVQRLAESWTRLDVFVRIPAAGRIVRAGAVPPGDAGVLDRARADAAAALALGPPEHAATFRARLDRLLAGRES